MTVKNGFKLLATMAFASSIALIPISVSAAPSSYAPEQITDSYYQNKVALEQGLCYDWMVFGVRGSGEPVEGAVGIGKTISVVFKQLQANPKFKDRIGSAYPVEYKALAVPFKEARADLSSQWWEQVAFFNNAHVNIAVRALSITCPSSKLLMVGYSQGAAAVSSAHNILVKSDPKDPILTKIRGAFLIASPSGPQRSFYKQANTVCLNPWASKPVSVAGVAFLNEMCKIHQGYELNGVKTTPSLVLSQESPKPFKGFKVRNFAVRGDLFADFSWGSAALKLFKMPTSLPKEFSTALDLHSSYNSSNAGFLKAIKFFAAEVR